MKEKSHKSRNESRRHDDNYSVHNSHNYENVLKEKRYKGESNYEKGTTKSQKSKSYKTERRRPRDKSNSRDREDSYAHNKQRKVYDESYEELSRKKRRIESELQALDLEEAAAREVAENKKYEKYKVKQRIKSNHQTIRVNEEPFIKEEPASDEDSIPSRNRLQDRSDQSSKLSKDNGTWGHSKQEAKKIEKEKPNFGVSGKLAEDTNTYNGVVIKYNEPKEARKPQRRWRLYPFKGNSDLPFIPIHRQSAYLFGRTRSIADIPIDHPSCSKQHAVLQFRLIPFKREDGTTGRRVRPYIIDLESSNGTFVNNNRIEPRCYVELIEKDVVKFGYSSREYVLLHEESKNDEDDDDVGDSN